MRANEFLAEASDDKTVTINIPITITIPSGGNPSVNMPSHKDDDVQKGDLPEHPIHMFPMQQEFELKKREAGHYNNAIDQILHDKGAYSIKDDVKENFDLNEDFELLTQEFHKSRTTRNRR